MKIKDLIHKFFCNIMGWHVPLDKSTFNGCSFCSKCRYCGKDIMCDSQGNWFDY